MALELIVHPGVDSAFIAWRAPFIPQCRGFALYRRIKHAPGSAPSPNTTRPADADGFAEEIVASWVGFANGPDAPEGTREPTTDMADPEISVVGLHGRPRRSGRLSRRADDRTRQCAEGGQGPRLSLEPDRRDRRRNGGARRLLLQSRHRRQPVARASAARGSSCDQARRRDPHARRYNPEFPRRPGPRQADRAAHRRQCREGAYLCRAVRTRRSRTDPARAGVSQARAYRAWQRQREAQGRRRERRRPRRAQHVRR